MNWPTAFCIVGSVWALAVVACCYGDFKKYRMEEVVKSLTALEKEVFKK